MIVVLAEKPSVARDLAKVLGATRQRAGYLEGDRYAVTWAVGHLLEIAEPGAMNPAWKRWCLASLPMLPDRYPLVARDERAAAQLNVIGKLFRDKCTQEIVCATDAGREGELIFWYIYEACEARAPVSRLWVSSLTTEEIAKGFASLRPASEYAALAAAARARSEADWLVGMNLTRAYRLASGSNITVGRVQTPTLAMIVARDAAIAAHVAETYFEVEAKFACAGGVVKATYVRQKRDAKGALSWERRLWQRPSDTSPLAPEDDPELIVRRAKHGQPALISVQRQTKAVRPPPLFDLTSLQRTANQLWGWKATHTLEVAQALYETEKVLTYPRTDSRHLSSSVAGTLSAVVATIRGPYEARIVPETGRAQLDRRFVDDARVTDHHAIIPTTTPLRASLACDSDAYLLYDLVCARLLCAWQPDFEEAITDVVFEVTAEGLCDRYVARGKDVIGLGWRKLEPVKGSGTEALPSGLEARTPTSLQSVEVQTKKTRAPEGFTDATLLSAMESAGEALDGEASAAMRERGLGTPATRAAIMDMLVARGYVRREGKRLRATELGAALISKVDDSVRSAQLTGEWEARLRRIERAEDTYEAFVAAVRGFVSELVGSVAKAGEAPRSRRGTAPAPHRPTAGRGRTSGKRGTATTKARPRTATRKR